MKSLIAALALTVNFSRVGWSDGQTDMPRQITVKLLNAETGARIVKKGTIIEVSFGEPANPQTRKVRSTLHTDGTARFVVMNDQSEMIYVALLNHFVSCTSFAEHTLALQTILSRGVLTLNTCEKRKSHPLQVKASEPGEIILFARPFTWWEKGQW